MKKIFLISFLIFLAFAAIAIRVRAASGHLLISEVQVGGNSVNDEFVELYNPTDSAISLKDWKIIKKTASGVEYTLIIFSEASIIQPQSFLVISHLSYQSQIGADFVYTTRYYIASNNTVVLKNASKEVVDKVGFGTVSDFETAPAPNPQKSKSLSRLDTSDTDDNTIDFEETDPSPHNWPDSPNDTPEPPPEIISENPSSPSNPPNTINSGNVLINELYPNPAKPETDTYDEWIELFNPNNFSVDLSNWKLEDKMGSVHTYNIPQGVMISPLGFLIFKRDVTKITLNNDGDIVEILDAQGNFVSDSGENYNDAQEGYSFALFGNDWFWSQKPTPGLANILVEDGKEVSNPSESKQAAAKKSSTKLKVSKKALSQKNAKKSSVNNDQNKNNLASPSKQKETTPYNQKVFGFVLIGLGCLTSSGYVGYLNYEKIKNLFFKLISR